MTALIDSDLGTVFLSGHAYDRMERHGIGTEYVEGLISGAGEWERSGDRMIADADRDGVVWRLVFEPESDGDLEHDWDLVTVTPTDVDVGEATDCLGEVQAINLALYSD